MTVKKDKIFSAIDNLQAELQRNNIPVSGGTHYNSNVVIYKVPAVRHKNNIIKNITYNKVVGRVADRTFVINERRLLEKSMEEKIIGLKNSGNGKVLVLLAPGPSTLEIPIEKLNNNNKIDVMTINKPNKRLWPTKFWMFCDQSQYERNEEEFHKYNGVIINSMAVLARRSNQIIFKANYEHHFSFDVTKGINIGRSTTYAAMQMALWMGYNKIFILGIDMNKVRVVVDGHEKEVLYNYGTNPDVSDEERLSRFNDESNFYRLAARIIDENTRKRFYFCSSYNPFEWLDLYNRVDHKVAVGMILDEASLLKDN